MLDVVVRNSNFNCEQARYVTVSTLDSTQVANGWLMYWKYRWIAVRIIDRHHVFNNKNQGKVHISKMAVDDAYCNPSFVTKGL